MGGGGGGECSHAVELGGAEIMTSDIVKKCW